MAILGSKNVAAAGKSIMGRKMLTAKAITHRIEPSVEIAQPPPIPITAKTFNDKKATASEIISSIRQATKTDIKTNITLPILSLLNGST